MEKVKFTEAQANALYSALVKTSRVILVRKFINESTLGSWEADKLFGDVTTDDFIRALYVGYEVVQTPEERIKAMYNRCIRNYNDQLSAEVIRDVLTILNIKIEGVNV